ncbi:hypothetical protein ACFT0G_37465 [Streptomyces sp. NPDC057020]|uniref:hypothetical protein n=1 Tax=unclassified Streptomyces TaxID=2593676 RepID=UPI003632FA21
MSLDALLAYGFDDLAKPRGKLLGVCVVVVVVLDLSEFVEGEDKRLDVAVELPVVRRPEVGGHTPRYTGLFQDGLSCIGQPRSEQARSNRRRPSWPKCSTNSS